MYVQMRTRIAPMLAPFDLLNSHDIIQIQLEFLARPFITGWNLAACFFT